MQKMAQGKRMSIHTDKNDRRHINIMVGGKRIHRILPEGTTAGKAKLIEAEIRTALTKAVAQKSRTVNIPGDVSLTVVMGLYVEHAKTLNSQDTSIHHALRLGAWAEKYRASEAEDCAHHFIEDARSTYAAATINRSLSTLKKGLTIAWRKKLIPENYGARIVMLPVNNQREVFLDVNQVRHLASFCSMEVQAVIWAALLTGCRRGELLKIRAEDIKEDSILIPKAHSKTKKPKVVPIVAALRPWLVYFPLTITVDGVKSSFRRARIKADLSHVNFHDLRHSCASILIGLGVDLYTVSKILGHASITTTQRYAHLVIGQQRSALEKIGNLCDL